ncbi:MAG: hypothetical protein U1F60_00590 [Planctomycetota bacterium]
MTRSRGKQHLDSRIAIGLRSVRGGAVLVAVAIAAGEPQLVVSTMLPTADAGDSLALAPYQAAASCPTPSNGSASAGAEAVVAEGRRRQHATARKNLASILDLLREQGHVPIGAALLVNRAGWVTDLLSYSLEHAEHVPVADGLAVRDAVRGAFEQADIAVTEYDEKSLPDRAVTDLSTTAERLDGQLRRIGATSKPWRKEQKTACLAAWHLLATSGVHPSSRRAPRRAKPRR